jgi:hypothetical protein
MEDPNSMQQQMGPSYHVQLHRPMLAGPARAVRRKKHLFLFSSSFNITRSSRSLTAATVTCLDRLSNFDILTPASVAYSPAGELPIPVSESAASCHCRAIPRTTFCSTTEGRDGRLLVGAAKKKKMPWWDSMATTSKGFVLQNH